MTCARCQQDNPPQAKFCLECGAAFKGPHERSPSAASSADFERALSAALEQQAATSEILRVISQSPTDVQPVFDTIVRRAARLLDAHTALVLRLVGDELHLAALTSTTDVGAEAAEVAVRKNFPTPLALARVPSHVVQTRRAYIVSDVEADPVVDDHIRLTARLRGYRSMLHMPMVRDGRIIGCIVVTRRRPGTFSDDEVTLLQTFADQAVIAIENVRLFKELEAKNASLTVALDQQTSTSEILRVIASSPTDLRPVLDALVENAGRLCEAADAALLLVEGDQLSLAASHGYAEGAPIGLSNPIHRDWVAGRAVVDARTVHVEDLANAETDFPLGRQIAIRFGHRTTLATPLLREGAPIGALFLRRRQVRPFSDKEIALLQTFADQAVIAIENVRLFNELQASNRELTAALDAQTATSEILRAISSSLTDVQPVFNTIVQSGLRLLGGFSATMMLLRNDDYLDLVAYTSTSAEADASLVHAFPLPLRSIPPGARAVQERRAQAVEDVESASDVTDVMRETGRARGWRSNLFVPMIRDDVALGLISITRRNPGPFGADQIALLETFAAQAVIAIENVRLFTELRERTTQLGRSVDELTALTQVSQALSSTLDLDTVLTTIVLRAIELSGSDGGSVYEYDAAAEEFRLRTTQNFEEELVEASRAIPSRSGALGLIAERREPVQIADISDPAAYQSRVREVLLRMSYRALLAVPLLHEGRLIGALVTGRKSAGQFAPGVIQLLTTFANQSALAIQNARLFRELADKSHQLEAASRHKSEFLANMSHELRTPLNAILGFSEVLSERMFGDLNEKQEEYLRDINASGQHLLALINDILDLSKIEAGRMELELTDFDLLTAIENALTLVRERAGRRAITLLMNVDDRLGQIRADERKIRQVVLNLLSNAIKFTPEGGRIEVRAVPVNGTVEVSVSDTGVGIAPEDQEAVFEEFRQVGTAAKKVEGTGLGLALSRKFIKLHGGRIWVKSDVGVGSTFTFKLPLSNAQPIPG